MASQIKVDTILNANGTAHDFDQYGISGSGSDGLGIGQTWQNSGKMANVTYTNNTGKPIEVVVTCQTNVSVQLYIDNILIGDADFDGVYRPNSISAIVPNGSEYRIVGTPLRWVELS